MILLAFVGLLACVLSVCSPLHRPTRAVLHKPLARVTARQLPLVAATQGYCSWWLDWAVLLSAATITIEVYLTLLPLLIWSGNEDFAVCRLLPQLALAGYVVFAIKDLLESPRPADCLKLAPNAHIVVRDPSGDIEDGVPSAHCCGAVSLLFYAIRAAAAAGLLAPGSQAAAQAAAAAWVVWLAWGRAYLGLHTPLDLASGSLLGWALIELWGLVEGPYVAWLRAGLAAPAWRLQAQVLALCALLMRCYPMPRRWTTCYNYATAWVAGWAGATLGWAHVARHAAAGGAAAAAAGGEAAAAAAGPGLAAFGGGALGALVPKVLLGLGAIAATKVVSKAVLLLVFKHTFGLVPVPVRCLWQPPIVGAAAGGAPPQQPHQQQQQQQQQRAAGKAAAPAAASSSGEADVGAARDAGGKQCQPSSGLASEASLQTQPRAGGGGGWASSSSSSDGLWCLRHSFEGLGNDVVAGARWGSYFAVGVVISLWPHWWPQLVSRFAYASSLS